MKPKDIDEKGRFSKGDTPWNKGKPWSEEVKLKLRQNHADMSDEKNPFYGKRHSEETKERIRQSMIGNQHAKGYSHTPDQNERNRQAHLGKTSWCKGLKGILKPNSGSFNKGEHKSPETEFKKGFTPWIKGKSRKGYPQIGPKFGEEHHNWKGGRRISKARTKCRRKGRGFIPLVNPPVGYDFQWHHVSPNQPYVVPCPTNIHNMFGGRNHYQNVNALLGIVRVAG